MLPPPFLPTRQRKQHIMHDSYTSRPMSLRPASPPPSLTVCPTLFAGSHVNAMLTSPLSWGAVLLGASQPKKLPTLTVYKSPISNRSFCRVNYRRGAKCRD